MPASLVVGGAEHGAAGARCKAKGESLQVTVQKMGQVRPTKLEIYRERDARTVSAKRRRGRRISTFWNESSGNISQTGHCANQHRGGPREIVRADLFPRPSQTRAFGVCSSGSESAGAAGID